MTCPHCKKKNCIDHHVIFIEGIKMNEKRCVLCGYARHDLVKFQRREIKK